MSSLLNKIEFIFKPSKPTTIFGAGILIFNPNIYRENEEERENNAVNSGHYILPVKPKGSANTSPALISSRISNI